MTILDLSNKEINDEIIKKLLAQLKNLKNIQGIKLNNNKITSEGYKLVLKSLINTKIVVI